MIFSSHRTSTIPRTNIILKKHFGPNTPPIELLVKNTTAFFINQHYSLTGVRPYIPTIVELGGLQVFAAKKKRKPKDFDEVKNLKQANVCSNLFFSGDPEDP